MAYLVRSWMLGDILQGLVRFLEEHTSYLVISRSCNILQIVFFFGFLCQRISMQQFFSLITLVDKNGVFAINCSGSVTGAKQKKIHVN